MYFSQDDHKAVLLVNEPGDEIQALQQRMFTLHRAIYSRLKQHNLRLSPNPTEGVSIRTNATPHPPKAITLTYSRTPSEALTIERIMGRDAADDDMETHIFLHPVLEVRLTPEHFAVELVISPEARYDQQNFVGKMSLSQHRSAFYKLLTNVDEGYFLGFWGGNHLDNMHLDTAQLPPSRILFEYLDTFAAGRDYFRLGKWYEADDDTLTEENIQNEVFNHLRQLYSVYDFMLWTSDNNFHTFFKKAMTRS